MIVKKHNISLACNIYNLHCRDGITIDETAAWLNINRSNVVYWIRVVRGSKDLIEKANEMYESDEYQKVKESIPSHLILPIPKTVASVKYGRSGLKAKQTQKWLKDHPNGTFAEFKQDTNGGISESVFQRAKRAVKNKIIQPPVEQYIPPRITLSQQVRDWLRHHPLGNRADFMKATGLTVSSSVFSTIKGRLERCPKPESLEKATASALQESKSKPSEAIKHQLDIEKENVFLKWWLSGERNGWVDMLLIELNK